MRIFLAMRIDADIRNIRHMSDIAHNAISDTYLIYVHTRDGHADAERLPIRKMRRYDIRHMSDISDISESMRIAKNIRMAIPNPHSPK